MSGCAEKDFHRGFKFGWQVRDGRGVKYDTYHRINKNVCRQFWRGCVARQIEGRLGANSYHKAIRGRGTTLIWRTVESSGPHLPRSSVVLSSAPETRHFGSFRARAAVLFVPRKRSTRGHNVESRQSRP